MLTTTSITAVSVSMRSAQATLQVAGIDPGEQRDARVLMHEADIDQRDPGQAAATNSRPVVMSSASREPCGRRLGRHDGRMAVIVVAMIVMATVAWAWRMASCADGLDARAPLGWRARAPTSEIRPARMAPSSGRKTIA